MKVSLITTASPCPQAVMYYTVLCVVSICADIY